jgi:hypothetical protein
MYKIRPIQEAINYDFEKQLDKNAIELKKAELEKKFKKYMESKKESAS